MQESTLLLNLAAALAVAGLSAAVAARLGQSVILGYVVAGVVIGTNTPGFTADPGTVGQLADVGVILLMFAVGMQLSVRDLFTDARVTLIGAHAQVALLVAAVMSHERRSRNGAQPAVIVEPQTDWKTAGRDREIAARATAQQGSRWRRSIV